MVVEVVAEFEVRLGATYKKSLRLPPGRGLQAWQCIRIKEPISDVDGPHSQK